MSTIRMESSSPNRPMSSYGIDDIEMDIVVGDVLKTVCDDVCRYMTTLLLLLSRNGTDMIGRNESV